MLSVRADTRVTISLPPIVMHMIKRLNYTGRRIKFVGNVLTELLSFWVNYPFFEEERKKEREGNLQVCFSK